MRRLTLFLLFTLLLAACGTPGAERANPTIITTPAANVVPAASPTPAPATPAAANSTAIPTAAAATPQGGTARLVVMSHDSFNVSDEVVQAFETANGVELEFLKAGDTGSALNRAILSKNAPLADVFFGVDNTFLSRALAADIFEPYASPYLQSVPDDLKLDASNRLLPIDFGYVNINYDKAALQQAGLTPPASLRDLTRPEWKGLLVVQNPATSSPGLAFLMATIGYFGESGDYTWQDFWRELRANDVYVSQDWSDAYYTQFSGSSGKGPRPLVVSYATSPAAEVHFSEGKLTEPPTGNLLPPGGSFRQVEFVGILKGTQQRALAEKFVDFMLQPQFQNDIPLQMFVYPASSQAQLPEVFQQFAEVPAQPAAISPDQIERNRETWIEEWTRIVLR
ncbi:MAG: thiamine ABC transporter substrate-binding protein [Chloroflexaceae bacterium]|nr:thiamine ABC transporter substrate-binding protein [Chloroflexaceae bacterium]